MDGYKKIVNIKWLLLSFVLLNACSVAKKEYVGIYVNNYPDFTGNFIFNKKKDTLRSIIQKESRDTIKHFLNLKKSENLSIDYKNSTKPDTIRKSFASNKKNIDSIETKSNVNYRDSINKKLPRKSPVETKEEIKTDSTSLKKLEAKQREKNDSLQVKTSDNAKHLKEEKKIIESKQNKKQDLKKINNRATSIDSAINKVKKDTVSLNHNNDSINKQKKHLNNFTSPKKNLKTKENDNYK